MLFTPAAGLNVARGWVALAALLSALGLSAGVRAAGEPVPARAPEIRALWVTHTALTSPADITALVRSAKAGGFNALLVQARARGDAYYESSLEPRGRRLAAQPEFDPLRAVLAAARPEGLQVHAWISVNLVSSAVELPPDRTHLIYRQPSWLMIPRSLAAEMRDRDPRDPGYVGALARWTRGQRIGVEGLYASPIPHGAAAHVAAVAADLAARYELDGVHLDYVRYPGPEFDYSPAALAEFRASLLDDLSRDERARLDARAATEPLVYADMFPRRWSAFRRSRLTSLVMRVRTAVKAVRPSVVLSAAVVPDSLEAAEQRLQDWRTWIESGLVDVVCPMAYTPDARAFAQQIRTAGELAGPTRVWAGIGAYRLRPSQTIENIWTARRLGLGGIALFSYDSLIDPSRHPADYLTQVGLAAFGDPTLTGSR